MTGPESYVETAYVRLIAGLSSRFTGVECWEKDPHRAVIERVAKRYGRAFRLLPATAIPPRTVRGYMADTDDGPVDGDELLGGLGVIPHDRRSHRRPNVLHRWWSTLTGRGR